jgi:hypothetical protein
MTTFKLTTRRISGNLTQIPCCNIQSSPITKVSLPSLFLSNTRSLLNKIEDLEIVIKNNNADIFCITDTWLSANIADSVVDMSGYTIVRKDRVMHKRGCGVCAFIKSSIGFTIIEELDNPLFECLWLYLRPPRFPRGFSCIIICIIYHPPLDDEAGLAEYLISSMDSVLDKNPNAGIFLVGDFNRFNFRILSNNFNLRQLVKAPTRGSATLDLILTNLFEHHSKPDILAGIGLSDHKSIFIRPLMHVKKRKAKVVYRRSVKPHMKDGFGRWLTSTNFTFLEAFPSCPEKLNAFQSLLNYSINSFFPLRKSKQHPKISPGLPQS